MPRHSPLLARFDRGELSFAEAAKLIEREKERIDQENEDLFLPYSAHWKA